MATDQRLDDVRRITASLEKNTAILYVQCVAGFDLYKTDALSKIDPYVDVALGSESSRSIALLRAGSNPVFDWSVAIPFNRNHTDQYRDGLVVTVWDQDIGSKDDEVGRGNLPIQSIMACETKTHAFRGRVKLTHKGRFSGREKKGGEVEVVVYWVNTADCQRLQNILLKTQQEIEMDLGVAVEPSSPQSPSPLLPLQLNYCVTNFNTLSGAAQAIIDKGKVSEYAPYRTYSMRLYYVNLVFQGFTKGWNKDYKAAQKIYGKSLYSKSVRGALRLQNFMAYSNDYGYVKRRTEVRQVSGLHELRDMLQSFSNECLSTRYTYVIMPDSHMHFSVTSKDTATDFLSKHALHAGAAPEVVYSGEFFFDQRSQRAADLGTASLVIDNNSGTFAPPHDKLHLLQLLMQFNFGTEMPILALDRGDPLLKQLSEENQID